MNGTVTLSLEDYELLKDNSKSGIEIKLGILKAAKELEVFLTFLTTRTDIGEYLEEFNSYSKTCKVRMIDGRAKIELLNVTEDEED